MSVCAAGIRAIGNFCPTLHKAPIVVQSMPLHADHHSGGGPEGGWSTYRRNPCLLSHFLFPLQEHKHVQKKMKRNEKISFFLQKQILRKKGRELPRPTNDIDRSINEAAADKIRKYRADYNNNPPNAVSFMPAIASTSGRLHSEFIRLLFLQSHRETDRFFETSGVQIS